MEDQIKRLLLLSETFKFDSKAQEKGFLAFIQWLNRMPDLEAHGSAYLLPLFILWSIQKDHESHTWWSETMGQQISMLEDQIAKLKAEIAFLRGSSEN